MSQQEEEPSRYTRTLVVKPALSQMCDQLLRTPKSLEMQTPLHSGRRPVTWVYLDLGISQTANGVSIDACSHTHYMYWFQQVTAHRHLGIGFWQQKTSALWSAWSAQKVSRWWSGDQASLVNIWTKFASMFVCFIFRLYQWRLKCAGAARSRARFFFSSRRSSANEHCMPKQPRQLKIQNSKR